MEYAAATSGPLTEFIVTPDVWSLIIALLAGVAGVLSMTTSKSSALVGVFVAGTVTLVVQLQITRATARRVKYSRAVDSNGS